MGRKQVAAKPVVAIVGYAKEKGQVSYAEQFKIIEGRMIDPHPVTLAVAKRFAALMNKQPGVRKFGHFEGNVPDGRRILFVQEHIIAWEITEQKYPFIFYAPGSEKTGQRYRYCTLGQIYVFDAQHNGLQLFMRVGHQFTPMPLPNINQYGSLCTGSIFDKWKCPNDITEAILSIEHKFSSARFTEFRTQVPSSLPMMEWWKKNAARNPDQKETLRVMRRIWKNSNKPMPLYKTLEDAQNSSAMADRP